MLILINEKAVAWFSKEFDLNKPLSIRMFPRYSGFGQKNKEYSLGFSAEIPTSAGYKQELNGITFYYEENDAWFFEDTETYLSMSDTDELEISFKELILN